MFILYRIRRNEKINYRHFHNPSSILKKAKYKFTPITKENGGVRENFPRPDENADWYRNNFGAGAYQIREAMGGRDGLKKVRTFVIKPYQPEEEEEDHSLV